MVILLLFSFLHDLRNLSLFLSGSPLLGDGSQLLPCPSAGCFDVNENTPAVVVYLVVHTVVKINHFACNLDVSSYGDVLLISV
jgi:hypothetical protein